MINWVLSWSSFSYLPSLLYVPSQRKVALYPSSNQSSVQSKTLVHVVQWHIFCRMVPTSLQSQPFQQEIQMRAWQLHHQTHSRRLYRQGSPPQGWKAQYWQWSVGVLSSDRLYSQRNPQQQAQVVHPPFHTWNGSEFTISTYSISTIVLTYMCKLYFINQVQRQVC